MSDLFPERLEPLRGYTALQQPVKHCNQNYERDHKDRRGVIVNVSATLRHFQLVRELSSGTWIPGRVSQEAVVLAALLALVGVAMAIYLIVIR